MAASYVWGPSKEDDPTILVNGAMCQIRQNLWDFLSAIQRSKKNSENPLILWIDALCIDQRNINERNHQVAMMGRIYSLASCVFAWVGPAKPPLTHFFIEPGAEPELLAASMNRSSEAWLRVLLLDLGDLQHCDYWSRSWIAQEYLLARRVYIWSGERHISDCLLEKLFLSEDGYIAFKSSTMRSLIEARKAAGATAHSSGSQKQKSRDLGVLFEQFGAMSCSIPHDKIYSLLGLLSKADIIEEMVIDYSEDVWQLLGRILQSCKLSSPMEFVKLYKQQLQLSDTSKGKSADIIVGLPLQLSNRISGFSSFEDFHFNGEYPFRSLEHGSLTVNGASNKLKMWACHRSEAAAIATLSRNDVDFLILAGSSRCIFAVLLAAWPTWQQSALSGIALISPTETFGYGEISLATKARKHLHALLQELLQKLLRETKLIYSHTTLANKVQKSYHLQVSLKLYVELSETLVELIQAGDDLADYNNPYNSVLSECRNPGFVDALTGTQEH